MLQKQGVNMSLLFLENFAWGNETDINSRYVGSPNWTLIEGGGPDGQDCGRTPILLRPETFEVDQTIYVGMRYKFTSHERSILKFYDDTITYHMELRLDTDKYLQLKRGGSTSLWTDSTQIDYNTWYYLEIMMKIGNADGAYEVRLDGVNRGSASGVDTQNGGNNNINRVYFSNDWMDLYTDIYICNSNDTGDGWTGFQGEMDLEWIQGQTAGDSTQFTPSAGSNYENIDENPCDDDTTYNESSTSGHKDLFNMGAASLSGNIIGMQVLTTAKYQTAAASVKTVVKIDDEESDGDETALDSSYGIVQDCFAIDNTDFATVQVGYEVV